MPYIVLIAFLLSIPYGVSSAGKKLHLKEYPTVIGCHHPSTGVVKAPRNDSSQDGACHYGKGWKNIMLPSKAQMKELQTVFKIKGSIITAITLISHESQWNPKAKGCHKGGCDYGLFQIRDVNGGKNMTNIQQMEWFKKRKAWQMSPQGNCYKRVQQKNHEKILRCIFARHNGALYITDKYPTERYREWQYINNYMKDYDF